MINMSVGANFRCISFDEWCDKLTDEQLEELGIKIDIED